MEVYPEKNELILASRINLLLTYPWIYHYLASRNVKRDL